MGFIPRSQGFFSICKSTDVIQYTNKLTKNPTIISINAEKAFAKIEQPFLKLKKKKERETLRKVGIEGTHLNITSHIQHTHS